MTSSQQPALQVIHSTQSETIALAAGEQQVVQAQPGHHYRFASDTAADAPLMDDVLVLKVGADLVVEFADGTQVVLAGYYPANEEEPCSVTVASDDAEGEVVDTDSQGTELDGETTLLYAYVDGEVVPQELLGDQGLLQQVALEAAEEAQEGGAASGGGGWATVLFGIFAAGILAGALDAHGDDDSSAPPPPTAAELAREAVAAAAGGNGGPPPTQADYEALGVSGVDTPAEVGLLGDIIAATDPADVDSTAELQALADSVSNFTAAADTTDGVDDGSEVTEADFTALGVTGVTADNLALVQAAIAGTADDGTGVDTVAEVQALVDGVNAAIAVIEDFNNGDGATPPPPTAEDYAAIGVTGVSADNLAAVNAQVLAAAAGGADTPAEVQALVDAADQAIAAIEAYNNGDGTTPAAPTSADYAAIGVTGVTDDILAAVNAQVLAADAGGADSVPEIQALADAGVAAVAAIEAYNNGDGTTPAAPTLQDYLDAGVVDVTADNLDSVNARILALAPGEADTVAEIQAQVDAANNALANIEAYNNGDGTTPPPPTVQDYVDANVTGVSADNLAAVNAQVLAAAAGGADTPAEIQALVTAADAAIAAIEAYNNGDGTTPPALTLQDYADAGITGVTADNLTAVNAQVLAAATGGADTTPEIQALVTAADAAIATIEAYNNGDGTTPPAPSAADYDAIGVTGVTADNLAAVNAQVLAAAAGGADTPAEVQALVTAADAAIAAIEAYNNGDGTTPPALTVQDYADAGITGVTADNLAAVNAQVLAAAAGGADTAPEIQAIVTSADAAIAAIEAYNNGDGSTPPALTVQDYADAGVTGVTADNLVAVNAQVLAAATGGADTPAEVQALVTAADAAIAAIEAYNNGDGTTPPALTAQDYADAGVTGVSADNLAAVNAQVLAAATGGADTPAEVQALVTAADAAIAAIEAYNNGDGMTPPALTLQDYADAGITGVSADNLDAINAAVLALGPGGADTVTEIQTTVDAVAPFVVSFTSTTADGSYGDSDSINITATLSEDVQAGDNITVTLDTGDTVVLTAAAAGNTLVGTYTVGAGDTSADLDVSSFVIGTVTDNTGNPMTDTTVPAGNNLADNSDIVVDGNVPSVSVQTGTFGPGIAVTTADGAYMATPADVDGDGDLDLIAVSALDSTVELFTNDGTGVFTSAQVLSSTSDGAFRVTSADLDGDGDLDVVVTSFTSDTVSWFENTDGMGTFGAEQVIGSENGARTALAADIDGDGDLDLVATAFDTDRVVWFENTDGAGTFGAAQLISNTQNGAVGLALADVDGDGDVDVISTSAIDDTVAWFANDGSGGFGPEQVISNTRDGAHAVNVGDIDGDGDIDLAVASLNDDTIVWFANDGSGNFGSEINVSSSVDLANYVEVVDLDGDGDLDLVASAGNGDQLSWFENDGSGGFGAENIIASGIDDVSSSQSGDLDGDGDIDVVAALAIDDEITVFRNGNTVNQGVALTFSSANNNLIAVNDDSGNVTVTLSVANGTVSVTASGAAMVTDNGTATVVITGTVADVNATLDGMTYTSAPAFLGTESLSVTVEDAAGNSVNTTVDIEVTMPPIALDLDGDGLEYNAAGVLFDADNDGEAELTAWVGADDALLALDVDGDGAITSGSEISFAQYVDGAQTDLEGLTAFDTNGNGLLDAGDDDFDAFVIWQDLDQDGVSDDGELMGLLEAGIESINLSSDGNEASPADGVREFGQGTYNKTDGSTGTFADVAFRVQEVDQTETAMAELEELARSLQGPVL